MRLGALGLVGGDSRCKETVKDTVEHTCDTHHVVVDGRGLQNGTGDDTPTSAARKSGLSYHSACSVV